MIKVTEGVFYHKDIQAILFTEGSSGMLEEKDLEPVVIGKTWKIAPWGADNILPQAVLDKIGKSEIMGSNIKYSVDVCYGLGPKLVRKVRDDNGRVVDLVEVDDGEAYEFLERNDAGLFMHELLTEVNTFHNGFVEMIPDAEKKKILRFRSLEATWSRFGVIEKGEFLWHYYSTKWDSSPTRKQVVRTRLIDEFDAENDIKTLLALKPQRMVYPVYMPSPGRIYYSRPQWYSLFESGWYDMSVSIPELKKAILKNKLGVKFIIYVSKNYFDAIFEQEGIDPTDREKCKERIDQEVEAFNNFLSGEDNAAKAMTVFKEHFPTGNGYKEEKMIEIEPIKNDFDGGEYLTDTENAANIISYAMGIHPSLIGAVPGKNSGSQSGTDKRELFIMKQALMKPMKDRCLRPLRLMMRVNGYDKDLDVVLPEFLFTTLDQAKSGKEAVIAK